MIEPLKSDADAFKRWSKINEIIEASNDQEERLKKVEECLAIKPNEKL